MDGETTVKTVNVAISEENASSSGSMYFNSDDYPDNPEKEGMTFKGWSNDETTLYNKEDTEQFKVAAGDAIVMNAVYEEGSNGETDSNTSNTAIDNSSNQKNVKENLDPTTDPEEEGVLGGPDTSAPLTDNSSSGNTSATVGDNSSVLSDPANSSDIIASGQVPTAQIGSNDVPYYSGGLFGSWALVNLILCIAAALLTLFTIIKSAIRGNKEEKLEEKDNHEKVQKRNLLWLVACAVFAIGGIVLFLLTQDTTQTMVMVDMWTIANAFLFVASSVSSFFVLKKDMAGNEDTDTMAMQ